MGGGIHQDAGENAMNDERQKASQRDRRSRFARRAARWLGLPALGFALSVFAQDPSDSGSSAAPRLDERIGVIERLNAEQPWAESQREIDALRASDALASASVDQRSRIDLIEARNLILAGASDAAMERLDAVLARPVAIDRRLRALELAANLSGLRLDFAAAFGYLFEGLTLLPQTQDPMRRSDVLVLASRFTLDAGEPALAIEYLSEALEAARRTNDPRTLCYVEQDLVQLQIRSQLAGLALESARAMWQTCQLRADPVLIGTGMMKMGTALLANDEFDEAIGWLERAERQHRRNEFPIGIAESRHYRGLALLRKGDFAQAMPLLLEAVEHYEALEDWRTLIELREELAQAFEAARDPQAALEQLRGLLRADAEYNDVQRSLRIAYQQADFENQRQQQLLTVARQRNEVLELERLAAAEKRSARKVAFGMSLLIALLLIGLIIRFRADRRRFQQLSERDGLTGLLNHNRFHRAADAALARARLDDEPCTLIAADVDLFKQINDRYGHQAGDAVLVSLAQRLKEVFPSPDIVGRVGGEEFAVFLPGENRLQARQRVEHLRRRLEPVAYAGQTIDYTLSFGVAEARRKGRLERLRIRADEALYRAKRSGRDQLVDVADLA
jgi:diguanylate cyclase (GGDEF)-like protein